MGEETIESVPADFTRLPEGLGYIDSLQPVYRCITEESARFGFLVAAQHCNLMGICHGGALMTLADISAATGVNLARGTTSGNPTVNLSIDFIAAARQGQWLEATVEQVNVKRRFGFCSGAAYNVAGVVARFSGTFYFPDHEGMLKDGRRGDAIAQTHKG